MKNWYEIRNKAGEKAEIWIYEQIGASFWDEGIEAKTLCKEISELKASEISVRINSPGGSVFDGQAIYNALKNHKAKVTCYIDGLAASIASVIALAGDTVVMANNALFMIHNPFGMVSGSAEDMRKYADVLDKVKGTIVGVYQAKCDKPTEELEQMMDAETWLTATDALTAGFVDEVSDMLAPANSFDLSCYRNAPKAQAPAPVALAPTTTITAAQEADTASEHEAKKTKEVTIMSDEIKAVATPDAAKIVEMCVAHNCADKAAEFIKSGKSEAEVAVEILNSKSTPATVAAPAVHINAKERDTYSIANAIRCATAMAEGRQVNSLEMEMSADLSKKLGNGVSNHGGIFVPYNAGLDTKTSGAGGASVFTQQGSFIDALRNASAAVKMGAQVLSGLSAPVTFPKQATAGTAAWVAENPGSDNANTDMTFTTVTLTPKTVMSNTAFSKQLMVESGVDIENIVRNDLAAVLALAWDAAAFHGTNSNNQPAGIYAASNVNAVAFGGTPTSLAKFIDMVTEIAKDNALLGEIGFVTTPGMAGKLAQTLEASTAGAQMVWTGGIPEGKLSGYRAFATNQISSTLGTGADHGVIAGVFSNLLIGLFGALEVVVDPYTLKKQNMVEVSAYQLCDIAIRYPQAFCKATGATIS